MAWFTRQRTLMQEGQLLEAAKAKRAISEMVVRVWSQLNGLPRQVAALVPVNQKAQVIQLSERAMNSAMSTIWRVEIEGDKVDDMILDQAKKIRSARTRKSKKKS